MELTCITAMWCLRRDCRSLCPFLSGNADLVWIDGQALHLPALEWLLLQILLLNGYTYVSRRMLLAILERQTGKMMQDNTLSVHIARLRRALGVHEGQSYIVTEPGKGYRWRFPVSRTLEPEMKKNELMAI